MPMEEMHKLQQQLHESQQHAKQLQEKLIAKVGEEGAEEEGAEEWQQTRGKGKKERDAASPYGGKGASSDEKDKGK